MVISLLMEIKLIFLHTELNQEVLLQLSSDDTKKLDVEKGKKYFLVIHFENATGSYEIDWK